MKNASKRIIALLLAVVMIIGVLPFTSAANVGPFNDVNENDWFAPYVEYVYEYGLMNGTTKNTFEPNSTCTRAMAATVLYRIDGEPAVSEPATFTDLVDAWYKDPIAWAEDEGVVNGVGDGKFNPSGLVTREQLVTMIWRYAGSPEPAAEGGIDSYPDAKSVSDWAVKAFNWAIARGIINGKDGKLEPAGNATRAEFAKIITVYDTPCTEHTWVDGEVIKEATCTEAGEKEIVCSACGEKKTEEIPALGHDYVDGVCSVCGDKVVDVEEGSAVIYYTNDVHTYIDKDLSYDNIADLKAQTEALGIDTLLVDAGDHAQGTAFGGMDKGQTMIELMNAAGYDYATLGNHEFDYDMDGAMNFIKWADFTYLSANFYEESEGVRGKNVLDSYAIVELAGKKVALIGITTPESFTKTTPAYFQDENGNYIYGISGGDDGAALYADVQAAIDAAKAEGAEIIIALGHMGDDVASKPWTSEEVIANTVGFDAFIDGHSHSTVESKEVTDKEGNKVVLTQTGSYFDAIGKLTIAADGTITTELITEYAGSDASVKADVDAWIAEVDELLGTVVAKSEVDFIIKDENGRQIRKQETNLGDFCADALYYLFDNMALDVDVAIMNGGGIRADMPAGDISYKTTKTVHTFGNVACLQTITGQQLLDALEWGAKDVGVGENGGFLHVSGITYEIHSYIPSTVQKDDKGVWCGAPTGEYRVKNVMVGGEPLDVNAEYNLAGYNYTLRDLGDGFAMFDGAVNVLDYVMEDYLVLANYAQSFPEKTIKADNSVLGANYGDKYGDDRIEIISEEPVNNDFVLDSSLEDGEKVIIYNAGSGNAMSSTMNGYNLAGVAVAPADKTITTTDATLIWTVEKAADGTIKFVQGDKVLKCGVDGTYSNLYVEGDYADGWKLVACNEGNTSYYIQSATETTDYGPVYIEWYDVKGGFTAYGTSESRLTEAAFGFQFYTPNGNGGNVVLPSEEKVFEKVTADQGNWEGIYVIGWDDGTNANIFDGQNDADKNNVQVAIADGKVTVSTDNAIIITAVEGGYTLKAKAGYLNGALKDGAIANDLVFETEPAVATIVWTNGNPIITSAVGTIFRFNNASYDGAAPYSWFRFFKPTSSVQTPINLYKLTEEAACEHAWDAGVITTEPTCDAEGVKTFTCSKCGVTKTEAVAALGHNYVDGICSVCGDNENEVKYVAIYNVANAQVMTDEVYVYTHPTTGAVKDQLKSASATLKGGKLESEATNVVTFKIETNVDGITSFITEDGKFLYCDGTNVRLVEEGGDYTEFYLDEVDGGYYIRLANYLYNGQYAQYIEYYKGNYTCYGISATADTKLYVFNFYEMNEVEVCEHAWDDGQTTEPTCDAAGKITYTCTLCGETEEETIAALGHDFVDGVCSACGAIEGETPAAGYVKVTENLDDFSGEYLLVFEEAALAFDGSLTTLDTKEACLDVEIVDGVISGDYSANVITIASMGDGKYSVQAASGIYFSHTGTTNTLNNSAEPAAMTISIEDGNAIIIAEDDYILRFNNSEGQMRFRFYKQTSSVKTPIALYKFSGSVVTPEPPADCEHVWDDGVDTVEPTCTEEGECVFTCTLCGETDVIVLEALGHINEDGDNLCDDCGEIMEGEGGDDNETIEGFVLSAEIKDGDKVVIYNATNKKALTSTKSSYYFAGADIEANENVIITEDETMIWTVVENADGSFSFKQGDAALSIVVSGTYFNLAMDAADAGWTLLSCNADNNSYYVYSSTLTGQYGNVYLEWYAAKNGFSAYCTGADRLTEKDFGFQFYVASDSIEAPCTHEWNEGEETTTPDCVTAGEMTYTCILCGETKTEEIAALGHINEDGDNECDDCGLVLGGNDDETGDLTEVAFADLADGDVIMIVMRTAADMTDKEFVLLNTHGSTPKNNAVAFTGEHDETMYYTDKIAEDGTVTFTAGENNLYSTNGNNGLCCASSEAGVIGYDESMGYLTIVDAAGNTRYIGVYDNNKGDTSAVVVPNFRAYKMQENGTVANIGNQTLTIYKIG